ncbi:MAG: ABC transporter ATP-binding protein [Thermoprotei archaeon]
MAHILEVQALRKYYYRKSLFSRGKPIHAVDGVSFKVKRGEIFGVVGESGSGKTTLGLCTVRFIEPTAGRVVFDGVDFTSLKGATLREKKKKFSIVFQNPNSAIDPHWTVKRIVAEPLRVFGVDKDDVDERVNQALQEVGLHSSLATRRPHELSGGQKQRVAIARALVTRPRFIVFDEPTSALDASIQAQILNLLVDLQEKHDLTYIFISHDLNVVGRICDSVGVMYLGKMVEVGEAIEVFRHPTHPYTRSLLSSTTMTHTKTGFELNGDTPSPSNPPSGCRLHPRCPYATEKCTTLEPKMVEVVYGHTVACHNYAEIELTNKKLE